MPENQRHADDRDVDQEHRPPPERLDQQRAERRTGCGGEGAGRSPDPDRHLMPSGRGGGEDQGETRGRLQRAASRLDDAGADQHLAGHGETGHHRTEEEDRHAGQEDPFVAVAFREPAADQKEAGDTDVVGTEDPAERRLRRLGELLADLREGQRDNRDLHAHHEDGRRCDADGTPAVAADRWEIAHLDGL